MHLSISFAAFAVGAVTLPLHNSNFKLSCYLLRAGVLDDGYTMMSYDITYVMCSPYCCRDPTA